MALKFSLTQGGQKEVQFLPLDKWKKPSDWDGAPVQQSISGTATIEPITGSTFADGTPIPADEAGEWFTIKSNNAAGVTNASYLGDGNLSPTEVAPFAFDVEVTVAPKTATDVTSSEHEEVPQV